MEKITVFTKEDFRKWLSKNHDKETKVAVTIHKRHTGKPFPTHRELIEEAICYGWIDTTVKRVDDDTFIRHFSRRNKGSTWSDNTRRYARELIKDKRMTPHGLHFYKEGLKKKTHDHGIPKNPDMPKELERALSKNKKAKENFKTFPPSTKKMLFRWYLSAKLQETKEKRIKKIVENALAGKKNIF